MTGDSSLRRLEDVEGAALTYAEVKAIASGNPIVIEKTNVDAELARLTRLPPQHVEANCVPSVALALARVSRPSPSRLWLQPLLRALLALCGHVGFGPAPGASARRKCSRTGPVRPCRSITRRMEPFRMRICVWRFWGPATRLTSKRSRTKNSPVGLKAIAMPTRTFRRWRA